MIDAINPFAYFTSTVVAPGSAVLATIENAN